MADGNRMLLAELFPELPAADLDLLATSGTIEQDIDDFLQSRLTPEAKLVELRSHVCRFVVVFVIVCRVSCVKPLWLF